MVLRHLHKDGSYKYIHCLRCDVRCHQWVQLNHLAHLAVADLRIFPTICSQNPAQSINTFLCLICWIFREAAIQVLLDFFCTGANFSSVILQELSINSWILKAEIQRARKCFPQFAPEPVGKTDLNQPRALRVAKKRQVSPVS